MKKYINESCEQLYKYVLHENFEDAPEEIKAMLKRAVIDVFACIIAGSEAPVSKIARDVAFMQYSTGNCTIFGDKRKLSEVGAAFVNGNSSNALDADDGNRPTKGHASASILPAIFAASENNDLSGLDFLSSFLVSYEIGIRASVLAHKLRPEYHSTGSWSGMGIVSGYCRFKRYDIETYFHSLGLAEAWGAYSPMMRGVEYPCMQKDAVAWGSMSGTISALMAEKGYTGIPPIFTFQEAHEEISTLGRKYRLAENYFKPFCACRWTHAGVEAIKELMNANDIDIENIERIKILSFEEAVALPISPPTNTENAQYNLAFPIASYLVFGQVGPKEVLFRFNDPKIKKVMDKITAEIDADIDSLFPSKTKTKIIVFMKSGETYSSDAMQPSGDFDYKPFNDKDIEDKYHLFVDPVLGYDKAGSLYANLSRLEDMHNVKDVLAGIF
jgi:2-methylcitrate dehydratase PrpD